MRLQQRETLSLTCKIRYSHSCGWLDGREVRKDIPDPAPFSAEAMAWHIKAERCDWIGEFISESDPARIGPARETRDPRQRVSLKGL